MSKTSQPIIKWSGSKRSQAPEIIQFFPQEIDTYYEPFCGGASMMKMLLDSDVKFNNVVCSDINGDLIELWKNIKNNPQVVFDGYVKMWSELNSTNDVNLKRKYFEEKRDEYNKTHDPYIFFFIMRTTTNGMPRYNKNGEFNNSFHLTRNGIEPQNLKPIIDDWTEKLNRYNVEFRHCSYDEIFRITKPDDLLYLDPPYFSVKKHTMYSGTLDFETYFNNLRDVNERGVKFIMSFDGKSGNVDNTYSVPKDCYTHHTYIKSGNSSFKRTVGNDKHSMVYESLYLNFEKEKDGLW